MTFSIVAHDVATGQVGIAVASRTLATGARVPHIRTGVGAIASQALVNHYYGPRGLALLAAGASAGGHRAPAGRRRRGPGHPPGARHGPDGPVRGPHGRGVPGVVRPPGQGDLLGGRQHPDRRRRARGDGRGLRGGRRSCRWRSGWSRPCKRASRPAATSADGSRRRSSSTATRSGRCSTSGSTITPIRSPSSGVSSSSRAAQSRGDRPPTANERQCCNYQAQQNALHWKHRRIPVSATLGHRMLKPNANLLRT